MTREQIFDLRVLVQSANREQSSNDVFLDVAMGKEAGTSVKEVTGLFFDMKALATVLQGYADRAYNVAVGRNGYKINPVHPKKVHEQLQMGVDALSRAAHYIGLAVDEANRIAARG